MTTWEYFVAPLLEHNPGDILNTFGEDGWELVGSWRNRRRPAARRSSPTSSAPPTDGAAHRSRRLRGPGPRCIGDAHPRRARARVRPRGHAPGMGNRQPDHPARRCAVPRAPGRRRSGDRGNDPPRAVAAGADRRRRRVVRDVSGDRRDRPARGSRRTRGRARLPNPAGRATHLLARGGIDDPNRTPDLPFFIAWDVPDELHPGATPLEHPCGASGIGWVEIDGDQTRFIAWVEGAPLPVRLHAGEPAVRAVAVQTPNGQLVWR